MKSTLFKSQIINGTKDELVDQVKQWYIVASKIMNKNSDASNLSETTLDKKEIANEEIKSIDKQSEVKFEEAIVHTTTVQSDNKSFFNIYSLSIIIFLLFVIYMQNNSNNKLWKEIKNINKQVEQNKLLFDYYVKENKELLDKIVSTMSTKNDQI